MIISIVLSDNRCLHAATLLSSQNTNSFFYGHLLSTPYIYLMRQVIVVNNHMPGYD